MVLDGQMAEKVRVQVVKLGGDLALYQRAPEEFRGSRIELLHEEDPMEREREEVCPQQAAVVDDSAPAFAGATGRSEAARREAVEDACQDVVGYWQLMRRHSKGHGERLFFSL